MVVLSSLGCHKARWSVGARGGSRPHLCPAACYGWRIKRPPGATASGCTAEDTMNDELTARQRAISLRLAGQPVKPICSALRRTEAWFHKWWRRYLEAGPEGLYDQTRANHYVA